MEHELDTVEKNFGVDLGRSYTETLSKDDVYYPQIEEEIRIDAAAMSPHFETFYALERTVKKLIVETMESAGDPDWWNSARVPEEIRKNAEKTKQREIDSGVTPRSEDPIDFCTFGELGQLITTNWDIFNFLTSQKAAQRVMNQLNLLRGPIAHCGKYTEDEVLRLKLTVRDWFRLME